MPAITLAQAEAKLAEWLLADTAVASGQAVTIEGKSISRANSAEIRKNIQFWNSMVSSLTDVAARGGSGIRVRGVTPV